MAVDSVLNEVQFIPKKFSVPSLVVIFDVKVLYGNTAVVLTWKLFTPVTHTSVSCKLHAFIVWRLQLEKYPLFALEALRTCIIFIYTGGNLYIHRRKNMRGLKICYEMEGKFRENMMRQDS